MTEEEVDSFITNPIPNLTLTPTLTLTLTPTPTPTLTPTLTLTLTSCAPADEPHSATLRSEQRLFSVPSSRWTRRLPSKAAAARGHPCHSQGPGRFPSS